MSNCEAFAHVTYRKITTKPKDKVTNPNVFDLLRGNIKV